MPSKGVGRTAFYRVRDVDKRIMEKALSVLCNTCNVDYHWSDFFRVASILVIYHYGTDEDLEEIKQKLNQRDFIVGLQELFKSDTNLQSV